MSGNPPPNPFRWARGGCLLWAGLAVLLLVVLGIISINVLWGGEEGGGPRPDRVQAGASPTATTPAGTPAASPTPAGADRWTVVVTDPAGGLALLREGSPELPHRQRSMAAAGIEVLELVGGQYEDPGQTVVVDFYGGTLAEPLTGAQMDGSAAGLLQATFAANFPNLTPDGEQVRQYDAGPLGGFVGCSSYDGGSYSACGWLDEQTIGYAFVIGGTEADTAALLLDLRADTEVRDG